MELSVEILSNIVYMQSNALYTDQEVRSFLYKEASYLQSTLEAVKVLRYSGELDVLLNSRFYKELEELVKKKDYLVMKGSKINSEKLWKIYVQLGEEIIRNYESAEYFIYIGTSIASKFLRRVLNVYETYAKFVI